jgi:uncharacterized integral membrane protein (TIGR00698 family)
MIDGESISTREDVLADRSSVPVGPQRRTSRGDDRSPHWWGRPHRNDHLNRAGHFLPGLALAIGVAAAATPIAEWLGVDLLGYAQSPISPILLTVLLGLVITNTIDVPHLFDPGIRLCIERLLRIGVALLGVRLSLLAVGITGLIAIPLVVVCIAVALLLVGGLTRLLGLPRRLGSLIAVGTSICGITAIVATAPVIDADDEETSYAVATIALFGMAALFCYPFLAHLIFAEPLHAGLFLGTSIHDTSQVAGAGLTYQQLFDAPEALDAAVVTKLVRNLSMLGVIPLMGMLYHRGRRAEAVSSAGEPRKIRIVPLFVLGFLAMTLVRTIGDLGNRPFGLLERAVWLRGIGVVEQLAELGLLLAMAGVGLRTDLGRLRILGLRPLAVGLAAAASVGIVSMVLVRLLAALAII